MTFYKGSDSFFVKRSFIPRDSRKSAIGNNSEPSVLAIVKSEINTSVCPARTTYYEVKTRHCFTSINIINFITFSTPR